MPTLALVILLALGASDAKLMQAEQMLQAKDCNGIAMLFAGIKPSHAHQRDLDYARLLVQSATECRAKDPVLALDLTQTATRLAPEDYGVATANAESLLALKQRTAASKLLDSIIEDHPSEAVRARWLRGRLASKENDWAVALQVLQPIASDSFYGPKAQPLISAAQTHLQSQQQAQAELSQREQRLQLESQRVKQALAQHAKEAHRYHSGHVVWSGRGTVRSGGSHSWRTKHIQAGQRYILRATAKCTAGKKHHGRRRGGARIYSPPDLFGLDFRAYVGSVSMPLDVGLKRVVNHIPFTAAEDDPQVRIEDDTDLDKKVKCKIYAVSVRIP